MRSAGRKPIDVKRHNNLRFIPFDLSLSDSLLLQLSEVASPDHSSEARAGKKWRGRRRGRPACHARFAVLQNRRPSLSLDLSSLADGSSILGGRQFDKNGRLN